MIERYSLPEMTRLWGLENKYRTWLEVEIAICEAWAQLGKIPPHVPKTISERARIDPKRILEIEAEIHHDLLAFVKGVAETCGDEGKYIHFGVTSYDVVDDALSLLMRDAADLILEACSAVREAIGRLAKEHKRTLMMGRTHGVHAEPITFGHKLAVWFDEMSRNIARLERAREIVSVGKVSGAVGTYANVPPEIEVVVCRKLGLAPAPASTQILQRDRHAEYLSAIAICGASIEKFTTEIRNLARTEIGEVEEPFAKGQRGSSAMPHKRNPRLCEQLTGLARVLRGYAVAGMENVALWHERDLSNSAPERITIPDASTLLHYMLRTFLRVLDGLVVKPEAMARNVDLLGGVTSSEQVMLALVDKGMSREDAYKIVQRCAHAAMAEGGSFRERLEQEDEVTRLLSAADLDACFSHERHLAHVDEVFRRVGIE
jgi:adenylosuccinate lyase